MQKNYFSHNNKLDLDSQIRSIHKSTKTLFTFSVPMHDKLRQRFRWYYKWHLHPHSSLIHSLALTAYLLAIVLTAGSTFLFQQEKTFAASAGPNQANLTTRDTSNGGSADLNSGSPGVFWYNLSRGETSPYFKLTDFNFAIPVDKTITGIKVEVDRNATSAGFVDSEVKLVKNGTIVGQNKADTGTQWPSGGEEIKTYGGDGDLWGTSWSPSDINGNQFGFVISANATNAVPSPGAYDARIYNLSGEDYTNRTWVTVYYTDPVVTHTITASAGSNGSISPSGSISVVQGQNQSLTITANSGYRISSITVDGSPVGGSPNSPYTYTFNNVTSNHSISASFQAVTIPTPTPTPTATATPTPAPQINPGTSTTTNTGSSTTTGNTTQSSVALTQNTQNTTTAPQINEYIIQAQSDGDGTITPGGEIKVKAGENLTFRIEPKTGNYLAGIMVDGTKVESITTEYTFSSITSNHTITAFFAPVGIDISTKIEEKVKEYTPPFPIEQEKSGIEKTLSKVTAPIKNILSTIGINEESAPTAVSGGASVAALTAVAIAPVSNIISMLSMKELLHLLFYPFAALSSIRQKSKKKGQVLEESTGLPIPIVKITLLKEENDQEKVYASTYTDKNGSYAFVAEPGIYRLTVTKDGYASTSDPGKITVHDFREGLVNTTITMIQNQPDSNTKLQSIVWLGKLEVPLTYLSVLFLLAGTIMTLEELADGPNWQNSTLVIINSIFWIITLKMFFKKSPWGNVLDTHSKKPLELAIVRVIDADKKKLVRTAVTNSKGKFSTLVPKGTYTVSAVKAGFKPSKNLPLSTDKNLDTVNRTIALDPIQH